MRKEILSHGQNLVGEEAVIIVKGNDYYENYFVGLLPYVRLHTKSFVSYPSFTTIL